MLELYRNICYISELKKWWTFHLPDKELSERFFSDTLLLVSNKYDKEATLTRSKLLMPNLETDQQITNYKKVTNILTS